MGCKDAKVRIYDWQTGQLLRALSLPLKNDQEIWAIAGDGGFQMTAAEMTTAVLNWAPYRRVNATWQPYPLEDYMDHLESRLRAAEAFQPEDSTGHTWPKSRRATTSIHRGSMLSPCK